MAVGLARPHLPWVVPTDMFEKNEESSIKQPGSPYPPVRNTCRHHCIVAVTCRHAFATSPLASLLSLVDVVIFEQPSGARADVIHITTFII